MLTVCYNYYDNLALFERVREHYLRYPNPQLKFIFVDDGSKIEPLEAEHIPAGWQLYRIKQDLVWNYNGARNLAMHNTTTEWNFLTDLDMVMAPEFIEVADQIPERKHLEADRMYIVKRKKAVSGVIRPYKPHKSSFYITRSFFWSRGGYQETTTGYFQDSQFRAKMGNEKNLLDGLFLHQIEHYATVTIPKEVFRKRKNIPNDHPNKKLRFDWERIV